MIHTKELRFGNKVKTLQGNIITVQQLHSGTLIYGSQIELNREAVTTSGSAGTDYITQLNEVIKEVDYTEIDPISLTPEILQSCGFRNYRLEQWIFTNGNKHLDFEFTDNGLTLRNPAAALEPVKWLHQLQNFLFAIIGYELEVAL